MIGKVTQGKDFAGLSRYLTRAGGGDRVAWTNTRNLLSTDRTEIAREMRVAAAQSSRCKKPVYHVSLSFSAEDRPTRAQMEAACEAVLKDLGLQDHQAWLVAHRDTPHPHVHVMVNRVHPDTGKAWSASHDYRRIESTLRRLEQRWDLVRVPGHHARGKGTARPERSFAGGRRGARAFARAVHRSSGRALWEANTWQELTEALRGHGLRVEARPRGLVVTDGRRRAGGCRIASLGSRPQLEARYGQSLQSYLDHGLRDPLPPPLRSTRRRAQQDAYRRWRSDAALRSAYVDMRVCEAVQTQQQALQSATVAHRQAQFTLRRAHAQHQRVGETSEAFKNALGQVYQQPDSAYAAFWRLAGARSLEHAIQELQARPKGFGALRAVRRKVRIGLYTTADTTAARAYARRIGGLARGQDSAERNAPSEADVGRLELAEREAGASLGEVQALAGSLPDQEALKHAVRSRVVQLRLRQRDSLQQAVGKRSWRLVQPAVPQKERDLGL